MNKETKEFIEELKIDIDTAGWGVSEVMNIIDNLAGKELIDNPKKKLVELSHEEFDEALDNHASDDVCECGHDKEEHDCLGECYHKDKRGWCSCRKFKKGDGE